jgi:hypothetical protein
LSEATPAGFEARAVNWQRHENTSPFGPGRRGGVHGKGPIRTTMGRNHLARKQRSMQKFRAKAAQIGDNAHGIG